MSLKVKYQKLSNRLKTNLITFVAKIKTKLSVLYKKKHFWIAAGFLFVLFAGVGTWAFIYSQQPAVLPFGDFNIKALATDKNNCIPSEAAFLLSFSEPTDKDKIIKWLKTSPQIEYTLEKTKNDLEFKLLPQTHLAANTVYTFSYDPIQTEQNLPVRSGNSFAFQTQKEFGIEKTLPRDQSTNVPVNSAIELIFKNDINIDDLKDKVTFQPTLNGNWYKININTYSFAPDETMTSGTVYKVCVNGTLADALGTHTLGEDFVFKFSTDEGDLKYKFQFFIENENNAFMTTETPAFDVSFNSMADKSNGFSVKIYQFNDINNYAKAVSDRLNYDFWDGQTRPKIDTSALNKVYENQIEIYGGDYGGVVVIPEILQKGFYAAEFTLGGYTEISLFQITDLSAYAVSDKDDRLFWVNDLATSLPVSGAQVSKINGANIGTTDAQGILKTKDPDNSYYCVQKGSDQLLVSVGKNEDASVFNRLDYWKYIYVDKQLYKPNDTLNFFGVISPKLSGSKDIDKVTAVVEKSYWDNENQSEIKIEVNVTNGVFEGQIQLPELAPDDYYLSIYYDDKYLSSTYFEVDLYKKPAYNIKLSSDKPIIWAGEEANVIATAEYFDGTPFSGLDIRLDGSQFKTDINGSVSVKVNGMLNSNYLISSKYISSEAVLPEIGDVYENIDISVVNSDIEINTTAKRNGKICKLGIQAFAVDFSGLDDIWNSRDGYLKDFDSNVSLKINFTKIEWNKIPAGQKQYDPYTKTYSESYRYERSELFEFAQNITVKGKDIQYFDFPVLSDQEYKIKIEGTDRKGRAFIRTQYLPSSEYFGDNEQRFVNIKSNDNKNDYTVGDEVSLSLYYNNLNKIEQGTVLFIRASDRIIDYTVTQDNILNFVFDNKYLPNINVLGVHFDGRKYIDTNSDWGNHSVLLNNESRALFVDVSPDKPYYKPGDTAKITLTLTDADNRPVKGYININMVDEALLSIREQYVDINARIFGDRYYFWPKTAISHVIVGASSDGGKGGEGEGERSDFRDTALFKTLETNNNGTAVLEVKLPDNITSWRIFWQAFRPGDIMAGSGRTNIISTLPFFADIRLNDTFITGDKPKLGIRNAGTALTDGNVQYTIEIPSLNFNQTETGKISVWTEIELPQLPKGIHDITVSAKYKEYSDKITTKFTVVDSAITHIKTDTFMLSKNNTNIDLSVNGTVNLIFSDKQKAQVIRALQKIRHTNAVRVEQFIAKKTAEEILTDTPVYGYSSGTDYTAKIANYQNSDGSISPFTYSTAELETTVWACAVSGESFNKSAAANYLYGQMNKLKNENPEGSSLALAGLAALKEPVLQYINDFKQPGVTAEVKLNLALIHIFFGDGGNAKEIVSELITDFCKVAGNTMYWDANEREETIKFTANLAAAAVLLDMPEGDLLFQYVLENKGVDDLYLLQQVMVLKHKAQKVNADCATFTYTLDSEEKEIKLWVSHSLMLTAEQLREIKFNGIEQEIEVSVSYTASGFPQGNVSPLLYVNQKYPNEIDSATQRFVTGEIGYGITAEAPDGYYNIIHMMPAGLDFLGIDRSMAGKNVWVSEVKGKQITFTVYKCKEPRTGNIIFNTKPTMTGSFKSEGSYIINATKPEIINKAEGGVIDIK